MFCEQCGKQLRDGARFCPVCGAEQGGVGLEDTGAALPVTGETRTRTAPSRPRGAESRPSRPRARKKKSKTGLIIALVLVLAVLAGGGWLLYQNVIFPKNTMKNAEALVEYLRQSPQRDNGEDFARRIGLYDKDYSAILDNRDAELKLKDYLREPYGQGDYHTWVHALYMLQECGLYGSTSELAEIVEYKDVEDLYNQGRDVNLDYGWFSDSSHVEAIYSDSPGFRDPELFDVYLWGDVMAVHSHQYDWSLFYRGYKMRVFGQIIWNSTTADTVRWLLERGRQVGDLLIFPYEEGFGYDNYYVLDTSTGESFIVQYDI